MTYIFVALLVAMAVLLITYPFLSEEEEKEMASLETGSKEQILATLNEIEFDYQTKKLGEDDYQYLKNRFERAAYKLYQQEEEGELYVQEGEG